MKTRPIVALSAALLLTGAIWAASTGPAVAHDAFVGSDPVADSTLTDMPTAISATFSADVVVVDEAVIMQVTGPNGDLISDGNPRVEGNTVTQPLVDHETPGTYSVFWRIVGSDGHPIEGQFEYSLDPTAAQPSQAPSAPAATITPGSPSVADAASTNDEVSTRGSSLASVAFWFAVTSIGLLVVVAASMPIVMARFRRRAEQEAKATKDDEVDLSGGE